MRLISSLLAATAAVTTASYSLADEAGEIVGKPHEGGLGFQPAATELARDIHWLDHMILIIITAIVIFVCALLVYIMVRYNRKANPNPASFTHNSPLEIAWTIVPIIILVFIGAFSLPVLFKQQEFPEGDINIKVTGYQWYWGYEYQDDGFEFLSYRIGAMSELPGEGKILNDEVKAELKEKGYAEDEFLLAVDNAVVVPVGKTVVMHVTGADVIHSWAMPAFGVKQDAVPGRLAQLWFKAEKEGMFFGQCSELCGIDHAYMPITVKVVSEEEYAKWLGEAKEEFANIPSDYKMASAN